MILSLQTQRVMAWCGLAFVAIFGGGMLIAGFVPPIPPDDSAAEVARHYQQNTNSIRLGCLLMLIGAGFTIPFFAVVTAQMRRIEGRLTALCLAQLLSGAVAVLVFSLPVLVFSVAAFRPDRDPASVQLLNDLGWFLFLMNFPSVTFQALVIAAAIFSDRNPEPVFPRWVGYAFIWVAISFVPGGLLTFFTTGPLAWDGLLSFWLAAVGFFGWMLVLFWATLRAVNRAPQEVPA